MKKIEEAQIILAELGLPEAQQNERSALILLALCQVTESTPWKEARAISMAVAGNRKKPKYPGIMRFIAHHYRKQYAENSRETFRRQTLHQLVQAGVVEHNPEDPALPTNSSLNHYRLSRPALAVIRAYGSNRWEEALAHLRHNLETLRSRYSKTREMHQTPLVLPSGEILSFSPGDHNRVQIAVIEEFGPRFAPGGKLLYVGDTASKELFTDKDTLQRIGIIISSHGKLPDVIIYDAGRNWLYLIEVVTAHGPISPKRHEELIALFAGTSAALIFITAFPNSQEFRRHVADIAWETEVWLADAPGHLIHFDGEKFLGPY